jgi:P2-related tail formation protein
LRNMCWLARRFSVRRSSKRWFLSGALAIAAGISGLKYVEPLRALRRLFEVFGLGSGWLSWRVGVVFGRGE